MSVLPLMVHGAALEALVVGGGRVAARKTATLLDAGARVRLVAPEIDPSLRALALTETTLRLEARPWAEDDIGDAQLVVAATSDPSVNARVVAAARARARLVNAADDASAGTFTLPAVHRAGEMVIAVYAGGVPTAAVRIRDAVAKRFDARYAAALATLSAMRRQLLERGEREGWRRVVEERVSERFCDEVDAGRFAEEGAT